MKQNVNAGMAKVGVTSAPDTHILQCKGCFMRDTITGVMNKTQEGKENRSPSLAKEGQNPTPPVRTAGGFLDRDPKNTQVHILTHTRLYP